MKVLVSVFNNLATDQRIEKICKTLHDNGYEVELIGNSWDGLPEMSRPYPVHRVPLKSKKLRFAYLEFNRKLYSELKKRTDKNTILLANDLDTLLPNLILSKKSKTPLIFDSHEIFTEMPSVQGRFVQKIWRSLQGYAVPKLKYMIAASNSYANWFQETYKISKPVVIQNFPRKQPNLQDYSEENTPKIIMYQGAINPSRGLDKIIPAMKHIENAELWIAGKGPKLEEYITLSETLDLINKVKFLGRISPENLREITRKADIGLSIEENNGLSYYYSLPNKVSDYIQGRVPVLVSNFPEMQKIVDEFEVGAKLNSHSEQELAEKISEVLNNGKKHYQEYLDKAASILCWENEEEKLLSLYKKVIEENF